MTRAIDSQPIQFSLIGILGVTSWLAITLAMCFSHSLGLHDVYQVLAFVLIGAVLSFPIVVRGEHRFAWPVALGIVFFIVAPDALNFPFGWLTAIIPVAEGGVEYGLPSGKDRLTPTNLPTGAFIYAANWHLALMTNGPIIASLCLTHCVARLSGTRRFLITLALLFLLCCGFFGYWMVSSEHFWFRASRFSLQLLFLLTALRPLVDRNSSVFGKSYSLAYVIFVGVVTSLHGRTFFRLAASIVLPVCGLFKMNENLVLANSLIELGQVALAPLVGLLVACVVTKMERSQAMSAPIAQWSENDTGGASKSEGNWIR